MIFEETDAFNNTLDDMGKALQDLGKGNWTEEGIADLKQLNDEYIDLVKNS